MTNALDLALANAAANAPQGEELHLENLDAIANPEREEVILHQYDPNRVVVPEPPRYNPKDVAFKFQGEEDNYYPRLNPSKLILDSIDYKLGEITNTVMHLNTKVDNISTIITKAASMSSEPNLKHRSLHEWDDSTLLNELVERENDLMPFYYELLKRIGSPELQSLVMSSMQGKNASMVTLAQLCSALAPTPQQSHSVYEAGISPSAEQRMDEAFHAATTPQTYTQAQLDNLRLNGQSSGLTVEEIALYEKMKRNSSPSYPATIPSMPPTYNPFFKEQ